MMRCKSGDGTVENTRGRYELLLPSMAEQCRRTLSLPRYFQLHYLFLSGEESSPGRSLQAHQCVVLLSNLSFCLLSSIVLLKLYTEVGC